MNTVTYTCGLSTRKLQQDFDINLDYIVRLKKSHQLVAMKLIFLLVPVLPWIY